jgi:hypothetical protein
MPMMLPETPGALLGYRKNGRAVYLIAGGDGTEGDPPQGNPPQGDPEPSQNSPEPPQPEPGAPPAEPQGEPAPPAAPQQAANMDQLPDWAQKLIRETRNDAARHRTKAKETEDKLNQFTAQQKTQLDGIAKALGLKQDDGPPDPKKLMEQLSQEQAARETEAKRAHQLSVELAVYRNASTQGADGNKLLDSRMFLRSVEGLDPTMADFEDQVKDKIAEAVQKYPVYKLTQEPAPPPPPSQGAPPAVPAPNGQFNSSPPQGPRQWGEAEVQAASAQELAKAIEQGLLVNYGIGRPKNRRV